MKRSLLLSFFILISFLGSAQEINSLVNFAEPIVVDENYTKKDLTRSIGIHISDIYNLNSVDGVFSVEFQAWGYGHKDSEICYIEFPRAQKSTFTGAQVINLHDSLWTQVQVSSTYNHSWDMEHFPFDKQTLKIVCENSVDTSFVKLKGDIVNSGVDNDAIQEGFGFVVTGSRFYDDYFESESNFGNPLMGDRKCTFSQFVAEIDIERDAPWTLFLKIFAAVIISFFISTIVFLINPRHFDSRFALPIGALFAAVGSKFVVDAFIGISTSLTLVDKIYVFTYIMIFIVALMLLISYKLYGHADHVKIDKVSKRKFDICALVGINAVYISVIVILVRASIVS